MPFPGRTGALAGRQGALAGRVRPRELVRARLVAPLTARARSTPARLTGLMVLLIVASLAFGAAGIATVRHRSQLIDDMRTRTAPLTVQAQDLFEALSDADTAATSAMLSTGGDVPALRDRYRADINAAADALATIAGSATGMGAAAVRLIALQLPVYTGLVETARTYHRQGLPLGASYMREASALMRQELLPAAQRLYRAEEASLETGRQTAASFPWAALGLGLLALAALVLGQVYLARRTRRLLNIPLVVATLATLVPLLWIGIAWHRVDEHLAASHHDALLVEMLADARTAARQARADEALLLMSPENRDAAEKNFTAIMDRLVGADGNGGIFQDASREAAAKPELATRIGTARLYVKTWRDNHERLRDHDNLGQHAEAVALMLGSGPQSVTVPFQRIDTELGAIIAAADEAFDRDATAAGQALSGSAAGISLLTLLALAGVAVGLRQRIAEYR